MKYQVEKDKPTNVGERIEVLQNESAGTDSYTYLLVPVGYLLLLISTSLWADRNTAYWVIVVGLICMVSGTVTCFRLKRPIAGVLGLLGTAALLFLALIFAMADAYSRSTGWG